MEQKRKKIRKCTGFTRRAFCTINHEPVGFANGKKQFIMITRKPCDRFMAHLEKKRETTRLLMTNSNKSQSEKQGTNRGREKRGKNATKRKSPRPTLHARRGHAGGRS
jgi:hypothetical protein